MRRRILMVAYACGPEATGEHWLGWGWVREASQLGEVHLITTPKFRDSVRSAAQATGVTCHFVTPRGPEGWLRKLKWQRDVYRLASDLHRESRFDLVHQTTFHTFRIPFRCAALGIPSVWGPIAGGESVPANFYGVLGSSEWNERARSFLNRLCLWAPGIRRSLLQSSRIFVSNRTTLAFLLPWVHPKCRVVSPNAANSVGGSSSPKRSLPTPGQPTRLLYVGNCVATRAVPLVLQALSGQGSSFYLKVVGGGPALEGWKRQAERLGVGGQVEFLGPQPKQKLPALYQEADLFVFPALRDSGGSALLEAMEQGLPVLCFPWGGPAEMVDEKTGFLVSLQNPDQTVQDIRTAMRQVRLDPEEAFQRAERARARVAEKFSWEEKRALLATTYEELIPAP